MKLRLLAMAGVIALASAPVGALAFPTCPANHTADGYDCTQIAPTTPLRSGGYVRVTFPSNWDGDLVIYNHGFDLNPQHIRGHQTCAIGGAACQADSDCPGNYCNQITYGGLDQILLPMHKAIAASTYHQTGWAVFGSAKDIKDLISFVKKDPTFGSQLKRVIITGHSLGGAVTADAILKLKIDGAVPMCPAEGGGLPTWDLAQDVRLIYDFICDDQPATDPAPKSPRFASAPDVGEATSSNSDSDANTVGLRVNNCFGNLAASSNPTIAAQQAQNMNQFIAMTNFNTGGVTGDTKLESALGFATIGLGDFVLDPDRLKGNRIGFNAGLDYSTIGNDDMLAQQYNMPRVCSNDATINCRLDSDCGAGNTCSGGVQRLTQGKGRKQLAKYSNPVFTKGKGAKVSYPILSIAGDNDWLVIPEFPHVFDTALTDGGKAFTQTWIDTFGHCVFTAEETKAVFDKFFQWLGPVAGPAGTQPSNIDVRTECESLKTCQAGANLGRFCTADTDCAGDTCAADSGACNFNDGYAPGKLKDRIPGRLDWPAAATE
ncbi:MAG TPA: hypothetical protein VGK20_02775 [Candidatus Binatia bacterium]|jgi:dienelactone hydrolase